MNTNYHTSVLLHESIDALCIQPDGVYVDFTFGGGGHSRAILDKLNAAGRLYAFDQDEDAWSNEIQDDRLIIIHQNFRHCKKFLRVEGVTKVNGILADLGVSSFQFDTAEKGFSYRFDAALDMRMDKRSDLNATTILNTYSESELKELFEKYGEVRNAKTLAKPIVDKRQAHRIESVQDFNDILEPLSFGAMYKYAAPVYQALRIEVNDELNALKDMLTQSAELLEEGGRLAVITFHSLEDRLVKNFMKSGVFEGEVEKDFFGNAPNQVLKVITKKPIEASAEELKNNPRSRSAKLRVAEKK
ncbi:MAG: 16S rRNA (cytosine(1402)-N(4))-methyltransferase RsmH [Bacteroidetes bacterium]|nr:16S rRNA (cytosine(1402)-N(4))-methyltransferase RsmH [Bacteroidota bacterium]